MQRYTYSAGAVKLSFWFLEFKKCVSLRSKGVDWEEIRRQALDDNIFGTPTVARAKQIYSTVSARIQELDDSFYEIFETSDLASQKLFCLAACMAKDTLFHDFVYEVIREKMIIGTNEFTDSDISIFFKDKQLQDETAAKWTDATLVRLGRSYKTMLYEAGLIDKGREVRKILPPIPDPLMEHWLEDHGFETIRKSIAGER